VTVTAVVEVVATPMLLLLPLGISLWVAVAVAITVAVVGDSGGDSGGGSGSGHASHRACDEQQFQFSTLLRCRRFGPSLPSNNPT
jgi:hypothetical protein